MNLKTMFRKQMPESMLLLLDSFRGNQTLFHDVMDNKQLIFIHIPKAAGTAIANEVFDGVQPGHFRWDQYRTISHRKFKKYFKFSFVRNPYDRFVSAFHYLQSGGGNEFDRAFSINNNLHKLEFQKFVDEFLSKPKLQRWVHFIPQHEFIISPKEGLMVDFLGRVENIEEDMARLRLILNIPQNTIRKENVSPRKEYKSYYNEEIKRAISEFYKNDLEMFNYRFL